MHSHLFKDGSDKCPKCGAKLGIKLSKYGAFVGCSNYPKCDFTKKIADSLDAEKEPEQVDETKPQTEKDLGENILFKVGKYGPYVTDGTKNVTAKKYNFETITLDIAKELLSTEKRKSNL